MEKEIDNKTIPALIEISFKDLEKRTIVPGKPFSLLDQARFPSLDGFRGISIILVIISHIYFMSESRNPLLTVFSGLFGVNIFFVISGFLITTLLLKEKEKNGFISLKRFYIRRILRIFPVAYLFLLVLTLLNLLFSMHLRIWSFIGSAFYFRNLYFNAMQDFQTGHFWSLSVEEQFYFIFPILLKKNLRIYGFALILLIVFIPMIAHARFFHWFIFKLNFFDILAQLVINMSPILVGSLTAVLIYKRKIRIDYPFSNSVFTNIGLFVGAAILASGIIRFIPSVLSSTLGAIMVMCLILNNLQACDNLFYKMLNSKPLMELGVLSYSLYIWQQIFTHEQPWKQMFPGSDSMLLNLPVMFVVSWVSYNFYEKRFLTLKSKFK